LTEPRRLLIDLGELQYWNSHFTGIQRCLYEVGRRLVDDEHFEVVCYYFDPRVQEFFVSDGNVLTAVHTEGELGTEVEGSTGAVPTVQTVRSGSSIRIRLRQIISRARLVAYRTARSLGVALLGRERAAGLNRARRLRHLAHAGARVLEFRPDDTVAIFGAFWDQKGMAEQLRERSDAIGFRTALLVYDLIPLSFPEFADKGVSDGFRSSRLDLLPVVDILLTISQATHSDVMRLYRAQDLSLPDVDEVIRIGDDFTHPSSPRRPDGFPDGEFILTVSTFEIRKNFIVLYQAVKESILSGVEIPRIVIVGKDGWFTADLRRAIELDADIEGRLLHLNKIDDPGLAWLYEHALFTVYPSAAEGWGLPIAEALSYGKFCITSGATSMPEIAGDLLEYVSPFDSGAWLRAIAKYASDPALLAAREERVAAEYRLTPWSQTADQVRRALLA